MGWIEDWTNRELWRIYNYDGEASSLALMPDIGFLSVPIPPEYR